MIKKIISLKGKNPLDSLLFFFFSVYPITFLLGNFAINLFLFLFNILLVLGFLKNSYDYKNFNKSILKLLFFLFSIFLINLFFSNNYQLTYLRVFKFILIIGSIISFNQLMLIMNNKEANRLFKIWSLIFVVVLFDIIFELIFKSNTMGLNSIIPGRIASFAGNELNIGHFFSAFCLFFMSFIYLNFKNLSLNLFVGICLIIISFLIGERSNFVRTIIIISIFIFLIHEINFKFKILSLPALIVIFVIFLNYNQGYKTRYINQFTNILAKGGISFYFDNSIYGAHYNVAKEIFKDNKFFGVGIKNFRIESFSNKYDNLNHKENNKRGNTHPHQIHYEFLAETGLVGYFGFAIFIFFSCYLAIKSFIGNRNLYQLSAICYVIICLLPIIPSGSFFSTYSSSLFWLNYAIMVSYIKK